MTRRMLACAVAAVPARLLTPGSAPDAATVHGALLHGLTAGLIGAVVFTVVAGALNPVPARALLARARGARGGAR